MLKAANSATKAHNLKIFDTVLIVFALIDCSLIYNTVEDFETFYACKIIVTPPIYLQNLSILC
ncbi:hypothetical protein [Desulfobacterium sp. N47]